MIYDNSMFKGTWLGFKSRDPKFPARGAPSFKPPAHHALLMHCLPVPVTAHAQLLYMRRELGLEPGQGRLATLDCKKGKKETFSRIVKERF